jgi:hypothetical protein
MALLKSAATKKLKEGVILFHGTGHAWDMPEGSFRGPGWFTTSLKTGVYYAHSAVGEFLGNREVTKAMRPGVLVYEVARTVPLYKLPEYSDVTSALSALMVPKVLTFDEWEWLKDPGWNMDWSYEKWDSDVIRKQHRLDDDDYWVGFEREKEKSPEWTLVEKMDRLGIDSLSGAIRAIQRADPSFHGWAINHGDSWEVMLCEPSRVLKRTDIWEVIQDAEEDWQAVTPQRQRRPSPARVAACWLGRSVG